MWVPRAIRCAAAASARTGWTTRAETTQLRASAVATDAADRDGERDQRRGVKRHVQMAADLRWDVPERVADVSAEDPGTEQQGDEQQRQRAGDHDQQLAEQQLGAEAA